MRIADCLEALEKHEESLTLRKQIQKQHKNIIDNSIQMILILIDLKRMNEASETLRLSLSQSESLSLSLTQSVTVTVSQADDVCNVMHAPPRTKIDPFFDEDHAHFLSLELSSQKAANFSMFCECCNVTSLQ